MNIWRNLEGGYHVHYSNKRDAVKGLKKSIKGEDVKYTFATCGTDSQLLEVPTDKKGLIKFLNEEAYYTGSSPGE